MNNRDYASRAQLQRMSFPTSKLIVAADCPDDRFERQSERFWKIYGELATITIWDERNERASIADVRVTGSVAGFNEFWDNLAQIAWSPEEMLRRAHPTNLLTRAAQTPDSPSPTTPEAKTPGVYIIQGSVTLTCYQSSPFDDTKILHIEGDDKAVEKFWQDLAELVRQNI